MREGLVRVSHAVDVFALVHGGTFAPEGGNKFFSKGLVNRAAFAASDGFQQPADGQSLLAAGTDRGRNLISGSADALGTDFDRRLHVVDSRQKHIHRILIRQLLHDHIHGAIERTTGDAFLAVVHQAVDEFGDQQTVESGVRFELLAAGGELLDHLEKLSVTLQKMKRAVSARKLQIVACSIQTTDSAEH